MSDKRNRHCMGVFQNGNRFWRSPNASVSIAVSFAIAVLSNLVISESAFALNSVVVESKSFAPGQAACTVGVFVRNDVPIVAMVLPLELRSVSGDAYIRGPFPSSFKFGAVPGNRIDSSPLGSAGENWPEALRVNQRYATPSGQSCTGPIANTYGDVSATIDGISPDAVLNVAISLADPSIGEEIELQPGSDPDGTTNASYRFIFNVDSLIGCFRIDTCCILPGNHLGMVAEVGPYEFSSTPVEFDRGIISVGTDSCPGGTNPAANNRPNAVCKDTVVVEIDSACTASVSPEEVDNGSWDVEDGTNLYFLLDPAGPFRIGSTEVSLIVCDQDGKCSSCQTVIIVRDTATVTIKVEPDSIYFHFSGDPGADSLCQYAILTTTGCGVRPNISDESGVLTDAALLGPWSHPTSLGVCVNPILAGNAPNGIYLGDVVVGIMPDPQRDTVVVVVEVEHPPIEPGCDSVCGFVLSLAGDPIARARVGAYTCDSTGARCAPVPGTYAFTNEDGAFCLNTDGWPRLKITANALGYDAGLASVVTCSGLPTYIYLAGSDFSMGGFPGAGPICVSQGFVLHGTNGDSLLPVSGAAVELWDSYPDGLVIAEDSTDAFGHFGAWQVPGDLVVRSHGFCPVFLEDVMCGFEPLIITLDPIPYAQPPNWPYFTDYYSTSATFEGFPIQPGDVIYATDPQGVICGIFWVTDAGTYLIHVLGDDIKTPEDEGAVPGDSITLWLNCECPVVAPDTWVNFGNFQFDAAWDCRPTGLCCVLCEGWNMWSYNIQLPSYARQDVLATIDLNYDAVRSGLCDYGSISWFAGRPVNDLTDVSPWYGYDIHMLQEDTVCLEGQFVDPSTEIYLCEGWNYIPYLPSEMDNLGHALQSLAGNYIHIFTMYCDYGVASWNETRAVQNNDLYCMEPCKGYWIKMKSDDTLIYPAEAEGCVTVSKIGSSSSSGRVTATPMVADYYAGSSILNAGSTISVRNSSGTLIGETMVGADGAFLLHVYGDVPQTSEVEGAVYGEELVFEVNGLAASASRNILWYDRDNQAIELTVEQAGTIPNEYALLQNYPNPFNAGTVIPFDLKESATWTLTIYNIAGQTVRRFAGEDVAGRVRVPWNGRNESGGAMASGVYFYRIIANEFTASRKMILMK